MQHKAQSSKPAHLVIVGFDDIVYKKYFSCIERAIQEGIISSYSIIELSSKKEHINSQIKQYSIKPSHVFYLPQPPGGKWALRKDFEPVLTHLQQECGRLKVYIATELKAHEAYLTYCIENNIDSLVEKPVLAPMADNTFDPNQIESTMQYLAAKSISNHATHSVMTLSRYHNIYNDQLLTSLQGQMQTLQAPLTSLHLHYAGGVWNRHKEYDEREDHPYKYGYGMLMQGGYHYLDLFAQALALNTPLFPEAQLRVTLSSYAAFPSDQHRRIPSAYSALIGDHFNQYTFSQNPEQYGETDITTVVTLTDTRSNNVIMLGSLALEQTTPSMRSWTQFPPMLYNQNGRLAALEMNVSLSTLYAAHVSCIDVPLAGSTEADATDTFATMYERTNASLFPNENYVTHQSYPHISHSDSNRKLLNAWLHDQEKRSHLHHHVLTMRLAQYMALSIRTPGHPQSFDIS